MCAVSAYLAALVAAMNNGLLAAFDFERYGAHQSAAGSGAVARIQIDVFAYQAARAMIGIAIALHRQSAFCAGKIFNLSLKSL